MLLALKPISVTTSIPSPTLFLVSASHVVTAKEGIFAPLSEQEGDDPATPSATNPLEKRK